MLVTLKQDFETATHRVRAQDVGKTIRVADNVGVEWCQKGYAAPADETAAAKVASTPDKLTRDEILSKSGNWTSPEQQKAPPTLAGTPTISERLGKVELLGLCAKHGVDASESDTKPELVAKLKAKLES